MDFYKEIVSSFNGYSSNDYAKDESEMLAIAKNKDVNVNSYSIYKALREYGCISVWAAKDSFFTINSRSSIKVKISHLRGVGKSFKAIISSKSLFKENLSNSGLSVCAGKCFEESDKFEAYKYFSTSEKSLVIKPDIGSKARGVTVGAIGIEQFDVAWESALGSGRNNKVIIEDQFINGFEARFLVIGGVCEGVYRKIPPFVIGDGKHSVSNLVEMKNVIKSNNPHQQSRTIIMNSHREHLLKEQGFDLEDVPSLGEIVIIDKGSNASSGADTVEFFENIHPSYKAIAEAAVKCANGLAVCGVDIMAHDFSLPANQSNYAILEANSGPGLGGHMFPSLGASRNVAEKIAEHAFSLVKLVDVDRIKRSTESVYGIKPLGFSEDDKSEFFDNFIQQLSFMEKRITVGEVKNGVGVVTGDILEIFKSADKALVNCKGKCFDYVVMSSE